MLGEVYSRTGSSFPVDMWQSTIQVRSLLAFDGIFKRVAKIEFSELGS